MSKFLARLFGGGRSPKGSSFHGSNQSINNTNRQGAQSSNMRTTLSLDNLTLYQISSKELEKNKLHKASWEGNINKVERLAQPSLINLKDRHSRTPLHLAVVGGHLNVIHCLIQEGALLNVIDEENRTPLVLAVLSNSRNRQLQHQICVALLNGGADQFINAVDVHGKNALHYAVITTNENLVDLFMRVPSCDRDFFDGDQQAPIHLAVRTNSPAIVYILLSDQNERQANPNLKNAQGQTPLHMAASMGATDVIRVLLQANSDPPCDPTVVDSHQLTALQIAKAKSEDICAKLIEEYLQHWAKLSPRREGLPPVDAQEINPVIKDKSRHSESDSSQSDSLDNDESSDEKTGSSSMTKPGQISQRPGSSMLQPRGDSRTLSNIITSNPIQPSVTDSHAPGGKDQTISSLFSRNPLKPSIDVTRNQTTPNEASKNPQQQSIITNPSVDRTTNQTISSLLQANPLKQNEPTTSQQQKQPPIVAGGSASLPSGNNGQTSTNKSALNGLIDTNPLTSQQQQQQLPPKTTAIGALVNSFPQGGSFTSTSNSYTQGSLLGEKHDSLVTPAKRMEDYYTSSAPTSDDDGEGVYHFQQMTASSKLVHTVPLNGTSMFQTTPLNDAMHESDTDEDSVEVQVRQTLQSRDPKGISSLVNQHIGSSFGKPQEPATLNLQSPTSNTSSWTASVSISEAEIPKKGISSLVTQQPLINRKPNEPALDDSRPLSADLKRSSSESKSDGTVTSSDDDEDRYPKAETIAKSPLNNGAISALIQNSLRPTDSIGTKPSGVENLTSIIDAIRSHKPAVHKQTNSPKPGIKSITSLVPHQRDSISSSSSSTIDEAFSKLTGSKLPTINPAPRLHDNMSSEQNWSIIPNNRNDLGNTTHSSTTMNKPNVYGTGHSLLNRDLNLRSSMSSSTSSVQNNMERISELKEDIRQIERKQEDSIELKRQLKEMEIKMSNFEALYKKNDQLLRETESKLEKEINEKQRLEYTTKTQNFELKSIKAKLQSLEDERSILDQRVSKLKEERDNYDEKLRIHQANTLQTTAMAVLREEDVEKIKLRHREEMKLLSAENDDLHQRTKQLQADLQLHKESLDVTIRYKIDLEKALEEKSLLQHELDRLKQEKDFIEQEKANYKTKYDSLQEEIRILLSDRSKVEQKLTNELQEQIKQRQRSTDDSKKYKTQIEQLNMKLGDAEARLLVLQTQNEALIASKDREIKSEFENLTQRLNMIESEKMNAEQRYHNEHKEIVNKQQQQQQPLVILASTPLSPTTHQNHQHSPSTPCTKCDVLQRSFEQEREQRLQTEKDNERLRDIVTRQKKQHEELNKSFQYHQDNENVIAENSRQMRSETERVKHELSRLRNDFDNLISNYEPPNNLQQQAQLHAHIDALRQFYEQHYRQQQANSAKTPNDIKSSPISPIVSNGYPTVSTIKHDEFDHSPNASYNCSICSNSRLLRERLDNAIDTSLADQRIQAIRHMTAFPRQTPHLSTSANSGISPNSILRKRYFV